MILGSRIDSTGISACAVSVVQPVGGTRGKQMCFMYKCSALSSEMHPKVSTCNCGFNCSVLFQNSQTPNLELLLNSDRMTLDLVVQRMF